jgi:hypothetical protein
VAAEAIERKSSLAGMSNNRTNENSTFDLHALLGSEDPDGLLTKTNYAAWELH